MIWWYWMLLGLVLLGVEMATPGGFYILFFGLAALIVGSLAGLGFAQAEWIQWLLFSGLAILSLLVFRGPLLAWIKTQEVETPAVDSMGGETAIPLEGSGAGWHRQGGTARHHLDRPQCRARSLEKEPTLQG